MIDADGANVRRVTDQGGSAPVWSPDGRQIAFIGWPSVTEADTGSTWAQQREIFVINADGTGLRNASNRPGGENFPGWSPDGKHIAFMARPAEGAAWSEIHIMRAGGGDVRRLTFNSRGVAGCCEDAYPRWSPNGQWISLISKRDGNSEIYAMRADGSAQTRLTNHPGFDGFANWSPSGEYIVFTSRPPGPGSGNLAIMRADGSELRLLPVVGRRASWKR